MNNKNVLHRTCWNAAEHCGICSVSVTVPQDSTHRSVTQFLVGSLQSQGSLGPAGQEVGVRDHHCHQTPLGGGRVRVKQQEVDPGSAVHLLLTCRLSPCTKTWATASLRTYTFSIFSGAMYSPCASLKMCFFLSTIFRVPFWSRREHRRYWLPAVQLHPISSTPDSTHVTKGNYTWQVSETLTKYRYCIRISYWYRYLNYYTSKKF